MYLKYKRIKREDISGKLQDSQLCKVKAEFNRMLNFHYYAHPNKQQYVLSDAPFTERGWKVEVMIS